MSGSGQPRRMGAPLDSVGLSNTLPTRSVPTTIAPAASDGSRLRRAAHSASASCSPGSAPSPDRPRNAICRADRGTLEKPEKLGLPWVARFDGTRWAVFGQDDGFPGPGQQATIVYALGDTVPHSSVAAGPDGTIWVATDSGLARFDRVTWTTLYRGVVFSAVSVAPDGTVWVSRPFGVTRVTASATSP